MSSAFPVGRSSPPPTAPRDGSSSDGVPPRLEEEGPSGRRAGAGSSPEESGQREAALRETARELEGVFIQKLFDAMRSTIPDGGYLDTSRGQEMFRGLMDRHLAETAAGRLERGLGEALYRQLREEQAAGSEAPGRPEA